MTKLCSRCGEAKPATTEYFPQRKTRLDSWCKQCYAKKTRDWNALKPEQRRSRDQAYYERTKEHRREYERTRGRKYNAREVVKEHRRMKSRELKLEVLNAYGGAMCRCCGETELLMLSLDHVKGDGAAHRQKLGEKKVDGRRRLGISVYGWLKKQGFPQDIGLQTLCMNCNWARHWNNGICPHLSASQELLGVLPNGSVRPTQAA